MAATMWPDRATLGKRRAAPPAVVPGQHRYRFRLHALDLKTLGLASDSTRASLQRAMRGDVLGAALPAVSCHRANH